MTHALTGSGADGARKAARGIQRRMKEIGVELSLGQAYEAVAAASGFRNWATMSAGLDADGPADSREEAFVAASRAGHVPVAMIDVRAEAARLGKLARRAGATPPEADEIQSLAIEYARSRHADREHSDYFDDWMTDRRQLRP